MRYTRVFLVPLALLLIAALVACGGGSDDPGGSGSASTSLPSQATPASPTEASDTPATPASSARAVSASPVAPTVSPGSTPAGASSSGSTPSAPVPTSLPEPTAVPARVVAPGLVDSRPCLDEFGDMLANYDGPEKFDAALVTSLSEEFGALRPDCLAQGWDPEFTQEPYVCVQSEDLPGAIMGGTPRKPSKFISPTMWEVTELLAGSAKAATQIEINVHLARVPLTSDIPSSMQASSGVPVGGCWTYEGLRGPDGQSFGGWRRSYFKYVIQGDLVRTNTVSSSGGKSNVLGVPTVSSYPGCDTLLQAAVSEELDAGRPVGLAGVDELLLGVRATAGAACAAEWEERGDRPLWQPSPVEGPSLACPVGSQTGLEPDGLFVVNWSEDHHDQYGSSACWVRSPEGEWGAYLMSDDGPSRPAARVVEEPPEADREPLAALYRALGGNRWDSDYNEFWMTDFPIAHWEGVLMRNGRVVRLNLAGAGLRGEIPAEIAGLTALEALDLGDNGLTGEIPPEVWGLSSLVELRLNGNGLTGDVTVGIANLTNLRVLVLAETGLTGCVPSAMRGQLGGADGVPRLPFCD